MFKNYLMVTLRNMMKSPLFSLINSAGLSIGIACCFIVMLFVHYEMSFDTFHENGDNIYRVNTQNVDGGAVLISCETVAPLGPTIKNEFPEIREFVRFKYGSGLFSVGDKRFYQRFFYASEQMFDVFSFRLTTGDPATALNEPNSAVITSRLAETYFGAANPVGKTLMYQNSKPVRITGILEEIPENSHFQTELLLSFSSLNETIPGMLASWDIYEMFYTYILLNENADIQALESKLPEFFQKHAGGDSGLYSLHLQPMLDIHLHPVAYEVNSQSSVVYSYLFVSLALFILLIAVFNFMNLSTARSSKRLNEIGVRKTLGARRGQLISQFLGESVILAVIAFILALFFAELFIPVFNSLTGSGISLAMALNLEIAGMMLLLTLFAGLLAGSYPSVVLSSFGTVTALTKKGAGLFSAGKVRKLLSSGQFAISIALMTATIIASDQLNFMKDKDLGFNQENVAVVRVRGSEMAGRLEQFRTVLSDHPGIENVTVSNGFPGSNILDIYSYRAEGFVNQDFAQFQTIRVDYDYFDVYGITMSEGREFSRDFPSDEQNAFIINKAAAALLGWKNPLNKELRFSDGPDARVIGVTEDFHYFSVKNAIEPIVFQLQPSGSNWISIKLLPGDRSSTMQFVEETWKEFAPGFPYQQYFIEDLFQRRYRSEERTMKVFAIFSALAVFIACLGMFGLATCATELRTKEIGIRKSMGATVYQVVLMLTGEFSRLALYANIIAWPAAYYFMDLWLREFPYRISVGIIPFLLPSITAVLIAALTVGFQSFKAAAADPARALRYE